MGIEKFDKESVELISGQAEQALHRVAERHGLELARGNGRYSAGEFKVQYSFKVTTKSGKPLDFEAKARRVGLMTDSWGREFTSAQGMRFRVTGVVTRRSKYPVDAERVTDGAVYKFTVDAVHHGLMKEAR